MLPYLKVRALQGPSNVALEIPHNQPRKKSGGPHVSQAVGSQSPRELPVKYEGVILWSCSYCAMLSSSTQGFVCTTCDTPRYEQNILMKAITFPTSRSQTWAGGWVAALAAAFKWPLS